MTPEIVFVDCELLYFPPEFQTLVCTYLKLPHKVSAEDSNDFPGFVFVRCYVEITTLAQLAQELSVMLLIPVVPIAEARKLCGKYRG